MKKQFLSLNSIVLALALTASAGDIWKEKPYETWDQKDVQKILNDSPWVEKVEIGVGAGPSMSTMDGGGPARGSQPGRSDMGRPANDTAGGDVGSLPGRGGEEEYVARWVSSRTLREAYAREAELSGKPSEEATKMVMTNPPNFRIVLLARDLHAFQEVGADSLKETVFLEMKKSHQKIVPDKITLVSGPDGKRVSYIVIDIPKTSDRGEATIPPEEKGADLIASAGKLKLKFHFDFSKMTDKQGIDL